jgi:hypothetical protein
LSKSAYHRTRAVLDDEVRGISEATAAVLEFGAADIRTLLPVSDIEKMSGIIEVFRRYEEMDPLRGRIVQLNVFCGAPPSEIVQFFHDESPMTISEVEGHLRIAKVYLRREMNRIGVRTA